MFRILLGVVVGIILVPLVALGWFWFGHVPVAVGDPPFSKEKMIVSIPLHARIHREMPRKVPLLVDEGNLVAGAHIYNEKCAQCHGFYGKPSSLGAHLYPAAPQLWQKHANSETIGVSDDEIGETYWKVSNGIRLTGMPAYKGVLNDNEIWQVSILLANADKPMPPAAIRLIRGEDTAITNQTVAESVQRTEQNKDRTSGSTAAKSSRTR